MLPGLWSQANLRHQGNLLTVKISTIHPVAVNRCGFPVSLPNPPFVTAFRLSKVSGAGHPQSRQMKIPFRWTKKRIARLGRESDSTVAASLAISPGRVRRKRFELGIPNHNVLRWSPAIIARLGRETDGAIAISLGIPASAVTIKRRSLGIPPTAKPPKADLRWTSSIIAHLGKMPDPQFAATYGIPYAAVSYKRHCLGIPGFR